MYVGDPGGQRRRLGHLRPDRDAPSLRLRSAAPELGVGLGVAVTAWILGVRHAFDADHISCIDNSTRKLMADGNGRSAAASSSRSATPPSSSRSGSASLRRQGGLRGGGRPELHLRDPGRDARHADLGRFLYLIAVLNLIVLAGIVKVFRDMRRGTFDEAGTRTPAPGPRADVALLRPVHALDQPHLADVLRRPDLRHRLRHRHRGRPAGRHRVRRDPGLPFYAVLALPLLFSGGMTLFDTLDGCFMNFAYGWAFAKPVRKVYYNLVITGLSIAAAFLIGTIEVLGVLTSEPI